MKKKKQRFSFMTMALLLCMAFFIAPATVFARDSETAEAATPVNNPVAPPTVEAEIIGSLLRIRAASGFFAVEAVYINGRRFNHRVDSALVIDIGQYIVTGNTIAIYAVDFAGNYSETLLLTPPPPVQPPPPNNITPDGQGEILDHLTSADNVEFITINTPSGNTFHLILDHTRGGNNVYLLNAVTEWDLMRMAADAELPVPPHISPPAPPEPIIIEAEPPEEPAPPEPTPEERGGRGGRLIFLAIAGAGAFGVIYYLKIVKPKQEREMYGGEADDFEDIDDGNFSTDSNTEREESI